MKRSLFFTMIIALIAMACSNESTDGPTPETGEQSVVKLTIYDATTGTRAAGTATEPPTTQESVINPADGIKVIVFDEDGELDYPKVASDLELTLTETSPGSGVYESAPFTVNAGKKYFYIFANDAGDKITAPALTMTRSQFISRTTPAALLAGDVLNLTDPNFMMGTLWSEVKTAPSGGTPANPVRIPLSIGRLASKVTLESVTQGTSTMQGTFGSPAYRLGTIPKNIFIVGNNDETMDPPPSAGHGVVISAVHDALPYTGPSDANFQQYSATWKNVDSSTPESFYTVENTTAPDAFGLQYYGNTSYIQIRTVYTPDASEISNVDNLLAKGSFTGPTFYTALLLSTSERRIFDDDPRTAAGNNPNADIDQSSIQVYTNGLNYHKFPIHDPQSGLTKVQRNTVLRNHVYKYSVSSIADIGSPDENVNPPEPIEDATTLVIEVTVAPWSKIENPGVPI